jgi:ribosomal protein RSM22 (predicted rRNA methylase)
MYFPISKSGAFHLGREFRNLEKNSSNARAAFRPVNKSTTLTVKRAVFTDKFDLSQCRFNARFIVASCPHKIFSRNPSTCPCPNPGGTDIKISG